MARKRERTMQITVLGKPVPVRFTKKLPRGVDGECDGPEVQNREIRIREGLTPERELAVLHHEYHHWVDWYRDESWVVLVGEESAALTVQLGWRKESE
jgi:hypothetical protein